MKIGETGNFQYNREALRAIRKKQYGNAIAILEKSGKEGLENQYSLFLLALALVYNNNFPKAVSVLGRIERINPNYLPYIQLKSFLGLKSALSREAAIGTYIEAIESASSDRLLKRVLREIENTGDFILYQKKSKIKDFVVIPKPKVKKYSKYQNLKVAGVFLALVFVGGAFYLNRNILIKQLDFFGNRNAVTTSVSSSEIDSIVLGSTDYGLLNRINRKKTLEFYHSREEVLSDFRHAKKLIKGGKENKALIILNRINNSNINYVAKEKVEFLIKFIMDSHDRKYGEYNLSDIKKSPHLYRGIALLVRGRTANVSEKRGGLTFSLLVNYSKNSFSEVINIFAGDKPDIKNGETVEAKGIFMPMKNNFSSSYLLAASIILKDRKKE